MRDLGDGAHSLGDALRQNEVTLTGDVVLRIPVLGLRLNPDPFLHQVVRAHAMLGER